MFRPLQSEILETQFWMVLQSFLHILSFIRAFKVCTTCLHVELKEGVASVDEFDKMAVLILVVQVRRLLGEHIAYAK